MWFINFLKFGTETNDSCKGQNKQGEPYACTTFTISDPTGKRQAPVEDVDGKKTIVLSTMGFTTEQIPDLDSLGNEQPDTINGGILMKNLYKWSDGSLVGGTGEKAPNKYDYQVFVTTPHKFIEGEKYRLVFWVRADKEATLDTQAHYGPGQYKDSHSFGRDADFPVTTEWKKFELGVDEVKTISTGARNCYTVCFNCYQQQVENKYYFRFDEDSFNENKIDFHVWNNPDSGISFADGKTVKTQLCISKGGWYYVYNVTLMSQDKYSETGISGVKSLKTGKNVLYNLAGQRVGSSYKGIVIKDGKKAVLK